MVTSKEIVRSGGPTTVERFRIGHTAIYAIYRGRTCRKPCANFGETDTIRFAPRRYGCNVHVPYDEHGTKTVDSVETGRTDWELLYAQASAKTRRGRRLAMAGRWIGARRPRKTCVSPRFLPPRPSPDEYASRPAVRRRSRAYIRLRVSQPARIGQPAPGRRH